MAGNTSSSRMIQWAMLVRLTSCPRRLNICSRRYSGRPSAYLEVMM